MVSPLNSPVIYCKINALSIEKPHARTRKSKWHQESCATMRLREYAGVCSFDCTTLCDGLETLFHFAAVFVAHDARYTVTATYCNVIR